MTKTCPYCQTLCKTDPLAINGLTSDADCEFCNPKSPKEQEIYSVEHYWGAEEGPSIYHVRCNHLPTNEEVIKTCGIDFDPKYEQLIIEPIKVQDIP